LLAGAALTYQLWWPVLSGLIDRTMAVTRPKSHDEGIEPVSGSAENIEPAGEGEQAHAGAVSLELSPQALKNLGLTPEFLRPIALTTYSRSISVPAVIVPRPGRTEIQVSTPLTGVITHVHAVTGESVLPGTLLFEIRLTHEDLVTTQTEFLKSLGELDVENREITRLEVVTLSGAVAGKTLLERRYSKEKLEALLKAQREALKLHGLSERQVDDIVKERHLLRDLQIVAPETDEHGHDAELKLSMIDAKLVSFGDPQDAAPTPQPLVMEQLDVHKGQAVAAGEQLCALADFSRLFIEGQAFEKDSAAIGRTVANKWKVTAVFSSEETEQVIENLELAFVGNSIDPESRAMFFYVDLPNEILRDETNIEKQRFVSWRFRPGQRLQVRVPVEEWVDQIVLPVDAVVKDGADWFVFQQNGDHFDRIGVHVKYRDQSSVVIDNDGSIYPGDVVARKSAHQMQMAIKKKSGGGADPHAGHNH
jgi:multidrug efflux pump subunit AcrA (membrane-fusion protein)